VLIGYGNYKGEAEAAANSDVPAATTSGGH
jgi:hypothetical protein